MPKRSLLAAVLSANQQPTAAGKLCARKMRIQKFNSEPLGRKREEGMLNQHPL